MNNFTARVPEPKNEPVLGYLPGSAETLLLKEHLQRFLSTEVEIPLIINGREIRTGQTESIHPPHNHRHKLGTYHKAGPEEVKAAIQGSMQAHRAWSATPAEERAAVFLKAAELISTKYRYILNASTMLGQSKTCYQAEIDAACEMADFFRFNVHFQQMMHAIQPQSGSGQWNRLEYRALEGFVFAVSPFNFTSIAGNLCGAPALLGNVSVWKPASTAVYSGYFLAKLFEEAGLPPGVIQFVPGSGAVVGDVILKDRDLGGIHFTGSTGVFNQMWKTVGENAGRYKSYPRIVGETGGKDFVFAHPSADVTALAAALIRGAFEYQGQKCSAASRAYVPKSLWGQLRDRLVGEIGTIRMGDVSDFRNFMGSVIDRSSFNNIKGYLDETKKSSDAEIVIGGKTKDEQGYFVEPTVIEAKNPKFRTMCEEIFGPVLTIHVYDDNRLDETLKLCDETSPYALTGAIFAQDRAAVHMMTRALVNSAGNFYINNKPTGAVVGQQPFGGARASGTNDKAGSLFNLLRWTSLRTVSETFCPPHSYRYGFLDEGP